MNVLGDIATDEMSVASAKVANWKLNCKLNRKYVTKNGGSEWGSNPPVTGLPAARRF